MKRNYFLKKKLKKKETLHNAALVNLNSLVNKPKKETSSNKKKLRKD